MGSRRVVFSWTRMKFVAAMSLCFAAGCDEPSYSKASGGTECASHCSKTAPFCEGDLLVLTSGGDSCDGLTGQCTPARQERFECGVGESCRDGACVDLCEGVVCPEVEQVCEGEILTTLSSSCDSETGLCQQELETTDCALSSRVCRDSECVDLCEGVVCENRTICGETSLWEFVYECDSRTGVCFHQGEQEIENCVVSGKTCIDEECVDVCASHVCETPRNYCEGNTRVAHEGGDSCMYTVSNGGNYTARCDPIDVDESPCPEPESCRDGECVLPGSFDNPGSIISAVTVDDDEGSALGTLLEFVATALGSPRPDVRYEDLIASDTVSKGALWPTPPLLLFLDSRRRRRRPPRALLTPSRQGPGGGG